MPFNDFLILASFILALCQRDKQRFYIAVAFSFSFGFHSIFSQHLSDFNYYLYDGLTGLAVIATIALFSRPDKFSDSILFVCLATIIFDFIGWFYLYENGLSPMIYNLSFTFIYLFAIYALLKGDNKSESFFISRVRFLRLHNWQGSVVHSSLHKKA